MPNLPLHFYLLDLIGDRQELPEIVDDNARCGFCDHYEGHQARLMTTLDGGSTHSNTSQSSRWDSMPRNDKKIDNRMRYPSRESHGDNGTKSGRDRNKALKQPKRTDSFCEESSSSTFALKDGLINPLRGGQGSTPQSRPLGNRRTISVAASSPSSSCTPQGRDVQAILDEAMDELQPNPYV